MTTSTQQLLKALGDIDNEDQEYIDEACLQRYLRATFGNVKAAAKQLKETLQWRKDFKPDATITPEIESFVLREKHYFAGVASNRIPVMVTRKRVQRLLPEEEDGYLRYLIYTIEKVIRAMEDDIDKWVWILDLKGYTSGNSPRLSMTRKVVKILADHYPERLHKAYIVDAPTVFYVLYKVVYPFLDKSTQEKIAFVYSANHDENGQPLPGKDDSSNFALYYKLYAKNHTSETYLSNLKDKERSSEE